MDGRWGRRAAFASEGGRIDLFVRGGDYTLRQQNLVDGSWGGWFEQDEFASNSPVGAAAGTDGSAWLAVRDADGGVHQSVI